MKGEVIVFVSYGNGVSNGYGISNGYYFISNGIVLVIMMVDVDLCKYFFIG